MSPRAAGPSVLAMRMYLAVAVLPALIAAPGAAAADEQAPIRVGRSETELLPSFNGNVGVGYRFAGLGG